MSERSDSEETGLEVAVIGMAGRFPGARSVEELWSNLRNGVESIRFFSDEELKRAGLPRSLLGDPSYVKAAGIVDGVDCFDATFFGYSPREAARMDPQQRIFLETAWTALESAAIVPQTFGRPIGVYAGSGMNAYLSDHVLRADGLSIAEVDYPTVMGNDKDFLTTRVSYKLNLEGPSVVVQTACSTSLVAIHLACQGLISAECDVALAGGVTIRIPQITGYTFQEEGIASPDGHCRAFDEAARGSVPGSGAAVVVLKRLGEALDDGDTIHAVIKGTAINNDGASKVSYTAPRVDGQARVIEDALEVAGTPAESIGYVEAHGTGTILGDPIEIDALTTAFRKRTDGRRFCGVGSIKTNLGHLDTAAGVAGFIKAVLCVEHGWIPPSLHYRRPNPRIDFESSPFFVVDTLREWRSGGGLRRAGVSSFGIGGTNAHAILEEPPARGRSAAEPSSRPRLFVLSAKKESTLQQVRDDLADYVTNAEELSLAGVARTLGHGRRHFDHRLSFVAESRQQMLTSLRVPSPGRVAMGVPRVGFSFPGQGSQYVDMGRGLYDSESVFRKHLDEGADLLRPRLDLDLRQVLYPSTDAARAAELLDDTRVAQPAIFLVSYALAKLWESVGVRPSAMLGHSIGEYVAACLAGVFSFSDALTLVAERGRLMGTAAPGAMLAVSQPASELEAELDRGLEVAAINAPALTVVSGPLEAIESLEGSLRERGVQHRRLRTSHAFHSSMMDSVLDEFAKAVAAVERRCPTIPYVSNLTGTWVSEDDALDAEYWVRHLRHAVRFADGLSELSSEVAVVLEVGPGRSLTSLSRRQKARGGTPPHFFASTRHPDETRSDEHVWLDVIGELWSLGVDVRLPDDGKKNGRSRRVPLPTYPFERQRHWIDPGAAPPPSPQGAKLPIGEWFSVPTWERVVTRAGDGRRDRRAADARWIVFEDPFGVGSAFADLLEAERAEVLRVRPGQRGLERIGEGRFSLAAGDPDAHRELARLMDASQRAETRVVHFWSVEPDGGSETGSEHVTAQQRRGFESILYWMQALGELDVAANVRLSVVTTQVQGVLGDEVLRAEKATVLGPVKVAPLEYPGCTATAIDIRFPSGSSERRQTLELVLATVLEEEPPPIIAVRGAYRWSQRFVPLALDRATPVPLEDDGVYLITGGTGGIGLALAEHLARARSAKLLLTGRTPLPDRAQWESIAAADESELVAVLEPLRALDAEISERGAAKAMSAYAGLEGSLDALCTAFALRLLGSCLDPSEVDAAIDTTELKSRLGLVRGLEPYFEMLLRAVVDDGYASRAGEERLRFLASRSEWPDPAVLEKEIRARYPDFLPLVNLLVHCLSRIGPVLRGEEEALGVLYGEGRELFRAGVENTLKHSYAALYHPLLSELVRQVSNRVQGRPLRVLEVGGGEGVLTEILIRALESHEAEYFFTDVGKSFVVGAEKRASERGLGWMRFGLLDISRPPIPQGFSAGQFDLVVAFNVVHATPQIEKTLGHLRQLTAPGGLVVLQESVRPRRWIDCIWGLTDGWWLFEDSDLRTESPLAELETWERAVTRAGFAPVVSYPRSAEARSQADSGVVIGQRPESGEAPQETEATVRSRVRKLLAIERLGSEVEVATADVTDRERMKEVVSAAESRLGKIRGVVHAALVLDDGAMQLKTRESFEKVLAPKVRGTLVLEEIFRERELDFFVMFSSLVSVLGGSGQVDYCAASNFQDVFAHQHDGRLAKTVLSIDWAAWREVGKAMREALARGGRPGDVLPEGMSTAEGIEAFELALGSSVPQILVSPRSLKTATDSPAKRDPGEREAVSPEATSGSSETGLEDEADVPRSEAERIVAGIWKELLGIEEIGLHDNFFELGADSIVSLQFIARARKEGFRFTNAQVFEYQTIADLLGADELEEEEND